MTLHHLAANEVYLLVSPGEPILPGDESWDSDFEAWEKVATLNYNRKVSQKDVVRRHVFDAHPLLRALLIQVEKLRTGQAPDPHWWNATDAYIAESKRRLGLRSFDGVGDDGVCHPAAITEPAPEIGDTFRNDVAEFRRRNRKMGS